jgi:hypothetical protein
VSAWVFRVISGFIGRQGDGRFAYLTLKARRRLYGEERMSDNHIL